MGQEFLNLTDPGIVKRIIKNLTINRKTEKIHLTETHGRILAEDVYATIDLPPFDRASMDGYAVQAKDTFTATEDNPAILNLLEVVKAGDVPKKKMLNGHCVEVGTGAPLPSEADAVVMVEFTDTREDQIKIYDAVTPGENIATMGSDIEKGNILLKSGTLITPNKIGVLSAIGISQVTVFTRPRVAIISTGNELIKPNEDLKYGQAYDINSETISSAVKSCGCIPIHSGIAKDDYNHLKDKISQFSNADIIITSGGTSAGAGDVLRKVIEDIGKVLVHGISVKPGKPTLIGILSDENVDKIIFGLPGNPVAALVVFQVFAAPLLHRMAGIKEYKQKKEAIKLSVSRRYHSARGRSQYVLVKIRENQAHPILKDSGAITALAEADGYFEVPKNVEIVEKDEKIDFIPLSKL
jgi:molybdopterin molybdotransferase